ncbi:aspartic peptidase domain-containing protein [Mycena maculata]|uniref:Aspartic peptidase domain-containing protein n=1 Tax=Mycena maculata TaxID=230809 RepID=A0AAD7NF54_9AGAR|nr:aspartic peptidase domain-containing protein [Mycena maculata]
MLLPASLLSFILLGDFACALRLDFEGRRISADRRGLGRRSSLSGSSPLVDSADLQYTTNITVGGQEFVVLIDTGSSDLWVAANSVSGAASTGKAATISYASGSATGPVMTGSVDFAGYSVASQAFINVTPDSDHPVGQGLIGLGPSEGSVVYQAFDSDEGNTILNNIFLQNTSTPNYMTFLLGRIDDPSDTFPGELTVGEVLSNYTNITSQPKLSVTTVAISDDANQHFQLLLDADGFIGPNGNPIAISSVVSATSNKNQATVVIDSGFSLPQVPTSVAEAIYGGFNGAELVNDATLGSIWLVPCTEEVNITLKFGGISYPVNPQDTTADPTIFGLSARQTSSGENACLGLFQPVSFDTGSDPTYDIIFGMGFLRNVYVLVNYGDFVTGASSKAEPYIQLLSITNPAEAHTDFVNTRLNGVDTTTDTFNTNNENSNSSSSSKPKTIYYIIAGCVLGALLLLIIGGIFFRRSRSRASAYRPLHLPAPAPMYGAPQMHQQGPMPTQPYGAPYGNPPVYNPDRPYDPPQERVPYHNPWEGRQQ